MGFLRRLRLGFRLRRIPDSFERQRVAIEWYADHPAELAEEWRTAWNGVDRLVESASKKSDPELQRAALLGKIWLITAFGVHPSKAGEAFRELHNRSLANPEVRGALIQCAFVASQVGAIVALKEDGPAALRRLEGEYFTMQLEWFLATFPDLANDFTIWLERQQEVSERTLSRRA